MKDLPPRIVRTAVRERSNRTVKYQLDLPAPASRHYSKNTAHKVSIPEIRDTSP
jgi:hypothetical protein